MRCYKPDMLTVLVILVAIGVITTASIQAQEIGNKQSPYNMKVSALCIDILNSGTSCFSHHDLVQAKVANAASLSDRKIWQAHTLDHEDAVQPTSLFALKDHSCDKASTSRGPSLNADFTDMKIGLSRYVSVDFEMDDISHLEISGVYLGFKDCWH